MQELDLDSFFWTLNLIEKSLDNDNLDSLVTEFIELKMKHRVTRRNKFLRHCGGCVLLCGAIWREK